jgi:hypothetical protein
MNLRAWVTYPDVSGKNNVIFKSGNLSGNFPAASYPGRTVCSNSMQQKCTGFFSPLNKKFLYWLCRYGILKIKMYTPL